MQRAPHPAAPAWLSRLEGVIARPDRRRIDTLDRDRVEALAELSSD